MRFLIVAILLLVTATSSQAQTLTAGGSVERNAPPVPDTTAEADPLADTDTTEADMTEAAATTGPMRALIDVLQDPDARGRLLDSLEASEGSPTGTDEAVTPRDLGTVAEASVARRIGEASQGLAQTAVDAVLNLGEAAAVLPRTLQTVANTLTPELLVARLGQLALTIIATYAALLAIRAFSMQARRRIVARAETAGFGARSVWAIVALALDVLVVILAFAVGYAFTLASTGQLGDVRLIQTLYLNAFLAVQLVKVVLRFGLSPRVPELRLFKLPEAAAGVGFRWASLGVAILAYGQLVAVPVLRGDGGLRAAAALSTVIVLTVSVIGILLVLRHRAAITAHILPPRRAGRSGTLLHTLLAGWWLPVIGFILAVAVLDLTQPPSVLTDMLTATAQILLIAAAGRFTLAALTQAMRRGVPLSDGIRRRLPLLERRLNGLVPRILAIARIIVGFVVIALIFDVLTLIDFTGWLGSDGGRTLLLTALSVALILILSSGIWIALSSWIEYRLNPNVGSVPTSRERTLLSLLRNAATIALLVITLMFVLSELGVNITPLLASAGVLGLAIGFGSQKMVEDIITGVFIQFENAINVGDVVTLGSTTGVVEKLTVRSVSLRDIHGVYHIVPFSSVSLVSNYMREYSYHIEDMGIAYREDVDEARVAMTDAFDALRADEVYGPLVIGDFEWFGVNAFDDSAVVVRARIKTKPGEQWGIGRAYKGFLKRIFDERGIEIPFPHQTVYFGVDKAGMAPPMHARIAREVSAPSPSTAVAEDGAQDAGATQPTHTASEARPTRTTDAHERGQLCPARAREQRSAALAT